MSEFVTDVGPVCRGMRAERVVAVAIHENPDSDAVGAAVGMLDLFSQLGVDGRIYVHPAQRLPIAEAFLGADYVSHDAPPADAHLYVIDCSSLERVALRTDAARGGIVNIDHHQDNTGFGDLNLVRAAASSTSEIVCDIAVGLGLDPRPWAANALYAGISFDSGQFRHDSTSAHTFECAAMLVRCGADPRRIYQLLYETRTLPTLKLWGRALTNLIVVADGAALVSVLSADDYRATGADDNETEGIVDFLRSIHGVQAAALVKQQGDTPLTRASLRSEGLDVAAIAALRGGGGHIQAAGFTVEDHPREVAEWLSIALAERLATASS